MPLTPAEKMKRYREKLKKDPTRYEEYKKKDLNRIKLKNKKICELSETEKLNQRKKWREDKRRQKEKNTKKSPQNREKQTEKEIPTNNKQERTFSLEADTKNKCNNKNHIRTIKKLRRMVETVLNKNTMLQKNINNLRKRLYRLNKKNSTNMVNIENKISKMKAREEVMECALREAYKSKNQKEKRILKSVINTNVVKINKCKTYVGNIFGLKGRIRIKCLLKRKTMKIKEDLKLFYMRDDISRSTSGKKECKTVNKKKHQIRYLTDKLFNLYQIYRNEGGKLGFTTFFRHKPAFILSPNIHARETCLCIKHSNMEMLFLTLLRNKVFPTDVKSLTDVFSKLTCDSHSFDCMYRKCANCKGSKLLYPLEEEALSKCVNWRIWERIDHMYEKMENGILKQMKTKKMVKNLKQGMIKDVIQIFEKNMPSFMIHVYNYKHQQLKYREKIANLSPDEGLLLVDFSENYECKSFEEVQATHFGASKSQITLHCGMMYTVTGSQSFCSISDSKNHEPSAIWAHLLPIIDLLKEKCPEVKRLHFFSDGPSSQYRQKKNFFLLNYFSTKLGFDVTTWNFSESGHGKGVADGIGGSVKRTLDKQVSYGRDITNGKDAFEILKSVSKRIQFYYINESEIKSIQNKLPVVQKAVPGTMQVHQIVVVAGSLQIQHRVLSCFCRIDKEYICECFAIKKHFLTNDNIIKQPTNSNLIPSTSNIPNLVSEVIDNNDLIDLTLNPDESDILRPSYNLEELGDFETLLDSDLISNLPILILNKNNNLRQLESSNINNEILYGENIDETNHSLQSDLHIANKENKCLETADNGTKYEEVEPIKQEIKKYPTNFILDNSNQITTSKLDDSLINLNKRQGTVIHNKSDIKKFRPYNSKENTRNNNPSIRTVVSRDCQCFACKNKIKYTSTDMVKCMVCKNYFCTVCSEGNTYFDFLCRRCFGEDY